VTVATTHQPRRANTATRILDVAERLVQSRGFNGFSYADVAAELRVTKASLHYHYPGKAELGEALIVRYAARFNDALASIDDSVADPRAKLDAYVQLYADVLRRKRMCLCGILAAEYQTLPKPMRAAVVRFFDSNEAWLTRVLASGAQEGTIRCDRPPADAAKMLLGGLEGAMLVARPYDDVARFELAARCLLASLEVPPV
jgi:TetR/AcrR family transcriptional regulator, transcriptional repressor for nem operon